MESNDFASITIEVQLNAPVEKVWEFWTSPGHITQWCQASDDWHAPYAENDIRTGGKFKTTMAAKDGSFSFDFGGVYDNVEPYKRIEYTMGDNRKVNIQFSGDNNFTHVIETFDAEKINSPEMQKMGWQSILNNFKKYVEAN